MKFKFQRGFTLIELLVVIAIIGILASIVLVSFPGANKKAKDSRVVGAISQARTIMAYVNANDNNYDAFKATHSDMLTIWAEIEANDREGTDAQVPLITHNAADGSGSSRACIYARLSAKDDWYYCADSDGRAGFTAVNPLTGDLVGKCAGTTDATCPTVSG